MTTPLQLTRTAERLAVAALTLAGFGIALNVQILGALGPFLSSEFDLSAEEFKRFFGSLVSAGWIAGAVGSLLLLPIVDRIGRKIPLVVGVALFAFACAGHLVAAGENQLVAVRIAAGLAGGGTFTIASTAVADLVPYERRGAAMGVFNLSIFLAVPVGMPLAVVAAEAEQWRAIFMLPVATSVLAVVGMIMALPGSLGRGGGAKLQWNILRVPHVVPALLSVVLYSGAFAATVQFLGLWLDESGIVVKQSQKTLWIVLGVVSALGTFGLTRLADVIGKRAYVIVSSVVVAAGFALLPMISGGVALVLVGVPIAAFTASRSGAMLALISGLVPTERRGSLMALRSVATSAGMGVLAWAGGVVYESSGYGAVLWSAAVAVVLSTLLVVLSVREGRA